jgi:hypothetical protein
VIESEYLAGAGEQFAGSQLFVACGRASAYLGISTNQLPAARNYVSPIAAYLGISTNQLPAARNYVSPIANHLGISANQFLAIHTQLPSHHT